ncbi:MAG: hypothetical protein IJC35_02480 [Oscillospiraceae bacterium]|nr:hypothetical protein [Oscillospiraceae bacterium]
MTVNKMRRSLEGFFHEATEKYGFRWDVSFAWTFGDTLCVLHCDEDNCRAEINLPAVKRICAASESSSVLQFLSLYAAKRWKLRYAEDDTVPESYLHGAALLEDICEDRDRISLCLPGKKLPGNRFFFSAASLYCVAQAAESCAMQYGHLLSLMAKVPEIGYYDAKKPELILPRLMRQEKARGLLEQILYGEGDDPFSIGVRLRLCAEGKLEFEKLTENQRNDVLAAAAEYRAAAAALSMETLPESLAQYSAAAEYAASKMNKWFSASDAPCGAGAVYTMGDIWRIDPEKRERTPL